MELLKPPGNYWYSRVRYITEPPNGLKLLIASRKILGHKRNNFESTDVFLSVMGNPVRDYRPNNGRFEEIYGIYVYKGDTIVTAGDLRFRELLYEGHEFFSHKKVPLEERIDAFVAELVAMEAIKEKDVRVGKIKWGL